MDPYTPQSQTTHDGQQYWTLPVAYNGSSLKDGDVIQIGATLYTYKENLSGETNGLKRNTNAFAPNKQLTINTGFDPAQVPSGTVSNITPNIRTVSAAGQKPNASDFSTNFNQATPAPPTQGTQTSSAYTTSGNSSYNGDPTFNGYYSTDTATHKAGTLVSPTSQTPTGTRTIGTPTDTADTTSPYYNANANYNYGADAPGATTSSGNANYGYTGDTTGTTSNPSDPYGAMLTSLQQYLGELEQRGQVLNPNVEITPEQAAQFLAQAGTEINPYYAGQLKLARESLYSSLGYNSDQIVQKEKDLEKQYGQGVKDIASNSADQGFAQSGQRVLNEQNLADSTQNTINQGRRDLQFNAGNSMRSFAQTYGSDNVPSLSLADAPQVGAGDVKFNRPSTSSNLYQLSPDVYNGLTGTSQYQQTADIKNRASQLEGAFRTTQANAQQRQLTL